MSLDVKTVRHLGIIFVSDNMICLILIMISKRFVLHLL